MAFLYFYWREYKPHIDLKDKHVAIVLQRDYQLILQEIKSITPSIKNANIDEIPFRINIMTPKFNLNPCYGRLNFLKICLFIKYSYKMKNAPDKNIVLSSGRGAAGLAYKDNKAYIADIRQMGKPGLPSWGLTLQEKKLTEWVNSIISTPILHRERKRKVNGVLNIDSSNHLEDTPFRDSNFQRFLQDATKAIAIFIK